MIQKILTADKSESFLNHAVGETYHSQTGAVEEALKKYALPCKIEEKAKTGKLRILDAFFGIGYNSAMAVSIALKANPQCQVEVIGLENDPEIIARMQEVEPAIPFYQYYKKIAGKNLVLRHRNVFVKVILGDIRETIKQLKENSFDAVFYDPFSPKTSPEMWTADLFKEIWRVMNKTAILATYSCARMVRENMSSAGLFYDEGPIVGRRGPGTIATKWII